MMRKPTRRTVTMTVTVSVPAEMSPSDARREVRCLINTGAGWYTIPGYANSVKARRVSPAAAS